jgi:RND family efflux transporter MFP subunit
VVTVTLSGLACHARAKEAAPKSESPAPRKVALTVVGAGAQPARAIPATVRARDRATLSARIPASVVALPFREGEHVAEGAVVARLEDSALRSALAASEIALASARADQQRAENLLAKGASTPREVEQARARSAAAEAAVQGARDQHAYAVLKAPFAGTIASRPANVGDVVNPGAPVIEIERDGGLEVGASLDSTEAAGVAVGQILEAQVDGLAQPVRATVTSLARSGDPATHRFELRAGLPASKPLRSGLFARLLVPAAQADSGAPLVVPQRAVFARGGLSGVYVVDGTSARLRWIAVGQPAGDLVEVRAGLSPGEKVVLEPAGLEDGAPVLVQ